MAISFSEYCVVSLITKLFTGGHIRCAAAIDEGTSNGVYDQEGNRRANDCSLHDLFVSYSTPSALRLCEHLLISRWAPCY